MKKVCVVFLLISLLLSTSCGGEYRSAEDMLAELVSSFDICGVLYRKSASEGEAGYIDDDFFGVIYDSECDPETDYAVFLSSSIDSVYEAAIFVTHDESSRIYAERLCEARVGFLSEMGYGEGAVRIRRRNVIFYSTLPDSKRAEGLFLGLKLH